MRRHLWTGLALVVLLGLAGCRSGRSSAESRGTPGAGSEALSLYERRMLDVIEDMNALDAAAEAADEGDFPAVQRQFHAVAGRFNSIIADNPEELEVRLIYAKLLDRFGDREGARDECGEVLRRDPTVAVAHQILGTYFAEEGDYAKALVYYLNAIQYAPDEPAYHFGLGDLLYTFRPGFIESDVFDAATLDEKMLEAFRRAAELAPDELRYQFRYGECFYDLPDPDWNVALAHWQAVSARDDLSAVQRDATLLHRARCLGELKRYDEARALAREISEAGLLASRDALLAAIDEAEAR